ncbi:hypothetical protein BZA05DRAFT_167548 [Tricharina praecox]|uniref:uncharacterized protein n=1 Tax=Tricharina praecox TaxID=43433 RepID=UPI00221FF031|nr:uncharacterized protein BZA05DRAFT_167548 [Tricharina praecox]KAI5857166.1 hypothetical protein BZA05DRAFT_167548 [Tricharina praecox]
MFSSRVYMKAEAYLRFYESTSLCTTMVLGWMMSDSCYRTGSELRRDDWLAGNLILVGGCWRVALQWAMRAVD